jgi:hypothetical protein
MRDGMLFAIAVLLAVVPAGVGMVVLGVLILKKRPVILPGWALLLFFVALALAGVLPPALGVLGDGVNSSEHWLLLLVPFMLVPAFVLLARAFGTVMLYNVDEDLVYKCLESVLTGRGIEWEERRGRIVLKSPGAQVTVHTQGRFGTANVFLPKAIPQGLRAGIVSDLRGVLRNRMVGSWPWLGLYHVLLGLALVALGCRLALEILTTGPAGATQL